MTERATKRGAVVWPIEAPKLSFGLGGLPDFGEPDDEVWLDQIRASEIFNHAVANARLNSYFESAVSGVLMGHGSFALNSGEAYDFGYILPGDEPEEEADQLAYRYVYSTMKARDELIDDLRRVIQRFVSVHARQALADEGTEETQHVQGGRHTGPERGSSTVTSG